jgi:putative transposase
MARRPERDGITLSDEQWSVVEPHISRSTARTGRPMADRRTVSEGMLYVLVVGCQWLHVPRHRYGPWGTVYHHCNRWRLMGVFDRLADRLRLRADRRGPIDRSARCADGTNLWGGPGAAASCTL